MNLKDAAAIAKKHLSDTYAAERPRDLRLENFLYDDHMMIWSLTFGFALDGSDVRATKLVRVSEANKSILSVSDHS